MEQSITKKKPNGELVKITWESEHSYHDMTICPKCLGLEPDDGSTCDLCDGNAFIRVLLVEPETRFKKLLEPFEEKNPE